MPNYSIEDSIVSYWNASPRVFNTLIAKLYAGEEAATPETTVTSPTVGGMPRAQYMLEEEVDDTWSRSTLVVTQDLHLEVWGTDRPTVRSWLKAISANFNNAESAITNPMTLDSSIGTILGVMQQGGLHISKEDDAVFHGFAMYQIRWEKPNSRPS
jgi:hypothetical protein